MKSPSKIYKTAFGIGLFFLASLSGFGNNYTSDCLAHLFQKSQITQKFTNNLNKRSTLEDITEAFSPPKAYTCQTTEYQRASDSILRNEITGGEIYPEILNESGYKVFGPDKEIDPFTGDNIFNTDFDISDLARDLNIRTALKKWMYQPVEDTLSWTRYIEVNEENYDNEVFESDTDVMILFYNNEGTYSKKLAALSRSLNERFPLKFLAYKLSDGDSTPKNVENHVTSTYPVDTPPALAVYKYKNGVIQHFETAQGKIDAFNNFESFLKDLPGAMKYLDSNLFD